MFKFPGIHKFTRKLLRPNRVPNNEILDLLSRVPDDDTLVIYFKYKKEQNSYLYNFILEIISKLPL